MKRSVSLGVASLTVVAGLVALAGAADDTKIIEYYRRKANIPPGAAVEIKDLKPSAIKGAKTGQLLVAGRAVAVTVSDDGNYVIFGEVEDIRVDPFKAVMEKIDTKNRPIKGSKDAKVVIVEYSDFQCPFCTRGYTTIEDQVLKEYGDKVKFLYKHFPLAFHPWAEPAAIATECALQQGSTEGYWKLYDYYFQNQKDITVQNLKERSLEALKGTKIDTAKFTDCLDNKKTIDIVKAQMAEGQSVGVTGTPGFIINGRLISGAQPFESFKAVIDDELSRAGGKS
jgi:protein-disulfide isomerase